MRTKREFAISATAALSCAIAACAILAISRVCGRATGPATAPEDIENLSHWKDPKFLKKEIMSGVDERRHAAVRVLYDRAANPTKEGVDCLRLLIPTLLSAINDPEPEIRRQLIFIIRAAHEWTPEVVEALAIGLNDSDEIIRMYSLSGLSESGKDTLYTSKIISMLDDPHPGVRSAAVGTLRRLAHPHPERSALGDCTKFAEPAIPKLLVMLQHDPEHSTRGAVAQALGDMSLTREEIFQALDKSRQSDPNESVRLEAAHALSKLKR